MRHRAWFTLLIRAIGIYLLATTVHTVVNLVVGLIRQVVSTPAPPLDDWYMWLLAEAGSLCQAALGFYLLFGGKSLINWCLGDLNCCPGCGYELRGVVGPVCPECGDPILREEQAPKKPEQTP